jgi:ribosomal protein L3
VAEIDAVTEALDARNSDMQRIAMALGWKAWEVGAEVEEHELINTTAKETRALEATRKRKEQAAAKRQIEIEALQNMSSTEKAEYIEWKKENKGKRLLDYLEETNKL